MRGRYDLHFTDNPDLTLGEAPRKTYRTLLAAANKFVTVDAPFKQIICVDDCGDARFLTDTEQRYVVDVAAKLGREVHEVAG